MRLFKYGEWANNKKSQKSFESEIVDISNLSNFPDKPQKNNQYFVIHHTAGRGTPQGVVNVLNKRGLSVQWVVDRDGRIYRTLEPNQIAYHAGRASKYDTMPEVTNSNSQGVEVIGKDDNDIKQLHDEDIRNYGYPRQAEAVRKIIKYLGYPKENVVGHGDITTTKQRTEGKTIKDYVLDNWDKPIDLSGFEGPDLKVAPTDIQPKILTPQNKKAQQTPTESEITIIFTQKRDPYSYGVMNGNWFIKDGPDKPSMDWYIFDEWTPLELNCKFVNVLDKKFRDARKPEDIELNRQKFCSTESDIKNNKKQWLELIGADKETIELGSNSETNNNPANLRYFDGFKGCQSNSEGYCKFEKLCFGYSAILNLLNQYYFGSQLDTIKKIIEFHHPPIDGNISDYISIVSSQSGISENQKLEIGDLVKLIPGIVKMETDTDVSLEEVINFINESENENIVIPETITHKGEKSTIIAPISTSGELPFFIIYPSYNDAYVIANTIIKEFSDWTTKYGFIFADDYDTKWEDIIKDFETKTPELSFKNVTMVLSDQSISSNVMYNLDAVPNIKNLVLINLVPTEDIINPIKEVSKVCDVYATYDIEHLIEMFGNDKSIKFIVDFKSAIAESTKGTDRESKYESKIKQLNNVNQLDFPKETLKTFKSDLELSV